MRNIKNQPFCWQEKKILRLIRKEYQADKNKKMKMLALYFTITWMKSDFCDKRVRFFTKTIHSYSGLSKEFIPKGLKELQRLKVLRVIQERDKGKFKGKWIVFTPEEISKDAQ